MCDTNENLIYVRKKIEQPFYLLRVVNKPIMAKKTKQTALGHFHICLYLKRFVLSPL